MFFQNVDDICRIYLPEFSYHELKIFVDNLYNALTNNTDCIIDSDLATCFGLRPDDIESNLISVTCLSVSKTTKSNEQIISADEPPFEASIPHSELKFQKKSIFKSTKSTFLTF